MTGAGVVPTSEGGSRASPPDPLQPFSNPSPGPNTDTGLGDTDTGFGEGVGLGGARRVQPRLWTDTLDLLVEEAKKRKVSLAFRRGKRGPQGRIDALLYGLLHQLKMERERQEGPRARFSPRTGARRVKIARAVARWRPDPHPWKGRPEVQPFRSALRGEWPKESENGLCHTARAGVEDGVVVAVEQGEMVEAGTFTWQEVPRLSYMTASSYWSVLDGRGP